MSVTIANDKFLKIYPETAYTAIFWIDDHNEVVNLVCHLERKILPSDTYYQRFLLRRAEHIGSPRYQTMEQAIIDWMVNH